MAVVNLQHNFERDVECLQRQTQNASPSAEKVQKEEDEKEEVDQSSKDSSQDEDSTHIDEENTGQSYCNFMIGMGLNSSS